jgi:phospholipid N-methyltransferase
MVELARARTGIAVQQSTFENFNCSIKFDGVWCCASLLHVPLRDIVRTIKKLVRLLKEQGIIYMSFKYGEEERGGD